MFPRSPLLQKIGLDNLCMGFCLQKEVDEQWKSTASLLSRVRMNRKCTQNSSVTLQHGGIYMPVGSPKCLTPSIYFSAQCTIEAFQRKRRAYTYCFLAGYNTQMRRERSDCSSQTLPFSSAFNYLVWATLKYAKSKTYRIVKFYVVLVVTTSLSYCLKNLHFIRIFLTFIS